MLLPLLAPLLAGSDARQDDRGMVFLGKLIGRRGSGAEMVQFVQLFAHEIDVDDTLFLYIIANTDMLINPAEQTQIEEETRRGETCPVHAAGLDTQRGSLPAGQKLDGLTSTPWSVTTMPMPEVQISKKNKSITAPCMQHTSHLIY